MSVLPPHLSVPCPCFTYVAVDLAGPFVCKREGAFKKTRRNPGTMKVWAVLFVCLQVKAVKIYLVGGLHTEDFLLARDSFVADHGQPAVAYSDRGTNLTGAAREGEILKFLIMTGTGLLRGVLGRLNGSFILQDPSSEMV